MRHALTEVDNEAGRSLVLGETKNKRTRPVKLPEYARARLREAFKEQTALLLRTGRQRSLETYVCAGFDAKPLLPKVLTDYARKLFLGMGLDLHFHCLRHTHATLLMRAGEHPKTVQERLGHSSVALTLDIYSQLDDDMRDSAAEKLDKMMGA